MQGLGQIFPCLSPEGIKSEHVDGSEAPLGLLSHMTAAQWRCAAKWELCLGDIFSCYYGDSNGVKAIMQITLTLCFVKGFASFYFVREHCSQRSVSGSE